jgi:hypothetical protein
VSIASIFERITSGFGQASTINANYDRSEEEFDSRLSRKESNGSNQMEQNIDLNSNRVINAADGVNNQDYITLAQAGNLIVPNVTPLTADLIGEKLYPQTTAETLAGLTITGSALQYPPGHVERYGAVADANGTSGVGTDSTQAFKDAVEQARHGGYPVTSWEMGTVGVVHSRSRGGNLGANHDYFRLTDTVNFRPVAVELDATTIVVDHAGMGIIIGGSAWTGSNPTQRFGDILRGSSYTDSDSYLDLPGNRLNPTVRMIGIYEQDVYIRKAPYIQHWSSSDGTPGLTVDDPWPALKDTGAEYRDWASLYARVHIFRCDILEVTDDENSNTTFGPNQFINSIYYKLHRIKHLHVDGRLYGHNDLIFDGGNFEGGDPGDLDTSANIKFLGSAHGNTVKNIRGEGYPKSKVHDIGVNATAGSTTIVADNTGTYGSNGDSAPDWWPTGKIIGIEIDDAISPTGDPTVHWTTVATTPVSNSISISDPIPVGKTAYADDDIFQKTGLNVFFGDKTWDNTVEQNWSSSRSHSQNSGLYGSTWYTQAAIATDDDVSISTITQGGAGNSVSHKKSGYAHTQCVAVANCSDVVLNDQLVYPARRPSLSTVRGVVSSFRNGGLVRTNIFPVEGGDLIEFFCSMGKDANKVVGGYRFGVECFNEDMEHFEPVESSSFPTNPPADFTSANITGLAAGSNFVTSQTNQFQANFTVDHGSAIKYVRCSVAISSASTMLASDIKINVRRPFATQYHTQRLAVGDQQVRMPIPHPVTAAPSQGYAPTGYMASDGTSMWRVNNSFDGVLYADELSGASTVDIRDWGSTIDPGDFTTGDVIGVQCEDIETTHWTTLTGTPVLDGSGDFWTATLTANLPDDAKTGARVVLVDWETVTLTFV